MATQITTGLPHSKCRKRTQHENRIHSLGSSDTFAALCLNGCSQKAATDRAGEWPSIQGSLEEWQSGVGINATVT